MLADRYQQGGAVTLDSLYVEREADRRLLEFCAAGEFVWILSGRQTGKTSLALRCKARLRAMGISAFYVDLATTMGDRKSLAEWLFGVLFALDAAAGDGARIKEFRSWWDGAPAESGAQFQRYVEEKLLRPDGPRVVVFLDEIGATTRYPFGTDLFHQIRALCNQRGDVGKNALARLSIVLVGAVSPHDLVADPADLKDSPFNIGKRLDLDDFTRAEMNPLAGPWGLPPELKARTLDRVYFWTGGQPYLSGVLSARVHDEARRAPDQWRVGRVDLLVRELFLSTRVDSNIEAIATGLSRPTEADDVRDRSLRLYRATLGWRGLTMRAHSPEHDRLLISGAVRNVHGRLRVRNRIYRRAFDRRWAWRKRPPRRFARFVQRHAVALLVALLAGGFVTVYVVWQIWSAHSRLTAVRSYVAGARGPAKRAAEERVEARDARILSEASTALKKHDVTLARQLLREIESEDPMAGVPGWSMLVSDALGTPGATTAILRGHTNEVTAVALSPDGTRAVTGSKDRTVRLWTLRTGEPTARVLEGHASAVERVGFSPDGTLVLSESREQIIAWDPDSGAMVAARNKNDIGRVAFSPDRRRVVTGSLDGQARLWDPKTGALIAALTEHTGRVFPVVFDPTGKRVVTASAHVWDARTGELALGLTEGWKDHRDDVASVAFSSDGAHIVTGSFRGVTRVWDAETGEAHAVLKGEGRPIRAVAFTPDGRVVLGSDSRFMRVWNWRKKRTGTLKGSMSGAVQRIEVSPDGTHVGIEIDRGLEVWSLESRKRIHTINPLERWAFSPDGARLAFTGSQATSVLTTGTRNASSGTRLNGAREREHRSLAFSADGQRLAVGTKSGQVQIFDPDTGKSLRVLKDPQPKEPKTPKTPARVGPKTPDALSVAFSPDGERIAAGLSDGSGRLWNAENGALLAVLKGHEGAITRVAFTPDGARVITESADRSVREWDADRGTPLAALDRHERPRLLAWSRDGSHMVTETADRRVEVRRSGKRTVTLKGERARVASAEISPGGARVLTVLDDTSARLWDATTGRRIADLRAGERRSPPDVGVFNANGKRLLWGARLWNTDTGAAVSATRHARATFSGGGHTVADLGAHDAMLWDAGSGAFEGSLQGHDGAITSIEFLRSSTVTGSEDRKARVWNSRRERAVLSGHEGAVTATAFGPSEVQVITGSSDRTARIWDITTRAGERHLKGMSTFYSVTFSPDGSRVASMTRDAGILVARVWDLATGASVDLEGLTGSRLSFAFSPDGTRVAAWSGYGAAGVWDATSGRELLRFEEHRRRVDFVRALRFSPDGRWIIKSGDEEIRVWDATDGTDLFVPIEGHLDGPDALVSTPGGMRMVTRSDRGTGEVWDLDASSGAVALPLEGGRKIRDPIFLCAGGTRAMTDSAKGIRLWDAETGEDLGVLTGSEQRPHRWSALSADGARIAAGWGRFAVWDAWTGERFPDAFGRSAGTAWAFSPGGTRIVTGTADGLGQVWDVETGTLLRELKGHLRPIASIAVSGDGNRAVMVSEDWSGRIWDLGTGETIVAFALETPAREVAFSPDGEWIVAGSQILWGASRREETPLELLWTSTPLCPSVERRVEVLRKSEAEARRDDRRCKQMLKCMQSPSSSFDGCLEEFRRSRTQKRSARSGKTDHKPRQP